MIAQKDGPKPGRGPEKKDATPEDGGEDPELLFPSLSSSSHTPHIDLTKEQYTNPMFMSEGTMKVLKVSKEEVKRMSVGNQTRYIGTGR